MNTSLRSHRQTGARPPSDEPPRRRLRVDRPGEWAVVAGRSAAGMFAVAAALFGVAYAVGGSDVTEDNWVAMCFGVLMPAGLLLSFGAFVAAVAVRVRGAGGRMMWLPLSLFPAVVVFVLLGELFWWE